MTSTQYKSELHLMESRLDSESEEVDSQREFKENESRSKKEGSESEDEDINLIQPLKNELKIMLFEKYKEDKAKCLFVCFPHQLPEDKAIIEKYLKDQCSQIIDVVFPTHPGKHCYIYFENPTDRNKAKKELQKLEVQGEKLYVAAIKQHIENNIHPFSTPKKFENPFKNANKHKEPFKNMNNTRKPFNNNNNRRERSRNAYKKRLPFNRPNKSWEPFRKTNKFRNFNKKTESSNKFWGAIQQGK